jgi:hypothetical protein
MTEDHESFRSFANAVHEQLPSEWNTQEGTLEQTDGRQAGFRRDDGWEFTMELSHTAEWPESNLTFSFPEEVGQVANRPGCRNTVLETVTVSKALKTILTYSTEYEGTLDYDEIEL